MMHFKQILEFLFFFQKAEVRKIVPLRYHEQKMFLPRRISLPHPRQISPIRQLSIAHLFFTLLILLPLTASLTIVTTNNHHLHAPPPNTYHVEVPRRVDAALEGAQSVTSNLILASNPIERVNRALALGHSKEHIERVRNTVGGFGSDTYVAPTSYRALLSTQSAWLSASTMAAEKMGPSFALTRPPGHHATRDAAMGFCLFNFAACAALELQQSGQSVGVLDIDVHFGNGSADILGGKEGVRYASVHQAGIYPGKSADSTSIDNNVLKIAVNSGCEGSLWLEKVECCLNFLLEENLDTLIVSLGIDGLEGDPLATLSLTPDDYAKAVNIIGKLFPLQQTVLGLEGGYFIEGVRSSVQKTCEALLLTERP